MENPDSGSNRAKLEKSSTSCNPSPTSLATKDHCKMHGNDMEAVGVLLKSIAESKSGGMQITVNINFNNYLNK